MREKITYLNESSLTEKERKMLKTLIQYLRPGEVITKHMISGKIQATSYSYFLESIKTYGDSKYLLIAKKDYVETINDTFINDTGRFCPRCGEENFSFAKYCSGCGYEIPERLLTNQVPVVQKADKENRAQNNPHLLIKKYGDKLISIAWVLLLILTNPSVDQHIEFVKDKIYEDSKKNQTFDGRLLGMMELIIGSDQTDILMNHMVKRRNYVVFSLTVLNINDKSEIIAIGILGVFIDFNEVEDWLLGF